jgi:hypothetical protein
MPTGMILRNFRSALLFIVTKCGTRALASLQAITSTLETVSYHPGFDRQSCADHRPSLMQQATPAADDRVAPTNL